VAEPVARGLAVRLRQAGPIPLDVELAAAPGAITALFGPSGAGKSTVLRSIAGLYTPAETFVRCNGEVWADTAAGRVLPPHRRSVGLVFQDYALFPHLDVRGQLLAAMSHVPRRARERRVAELLALVHLEEYAERLPAALSGGQQQRVAIARALARDPAVLLLDEPFASVDRALRDALQHELAVLHRALGVPVVLVTHDFEDVARLAAEVVVLEAGRVTAKGSVAELTAAGSLPFGLAGKREPAVALDAEVAAQHPERQLTTVAAGALALLVPAIAAPLGARVRLTISSREVILATERPRGLSLHNIVAARVAEIRDAAQPELRVVRLAVEGTPLLALVTADAVRNLGLAPGREVLALIKAVAVEAFA